MTDDIFVSDLKSIMFSNVDDLNKWFRKHEHCKIVDIKMSSVDQSPDILVLYRGDDVE